MEPRDLIEAYVTDVTQRLPSGKRADVALELDALLAEELAGRAEAAGRAADEEMTLAMLQRFGAPAEVAMRYQPSAAIIDPADTRAFLVAAAVGTLILVSLGQLPLGQPSENWQPISILSWLGLLVLFFGARAWLRRRRSEPTPWRPRDPGTASRFGSVALVLVIGCGVLAFGAPGWVFTQLSDGGHLSPQLHYAEDFRRVRLPWLIGVWGLTAALYGWIAVAGRWRPATRRIEAALQLATGLILIWFLAGGPMFRAPDIDAVAKIGVLVAAAVAFIDTGLKVRRLPGRSAAMAASQTAQRGGA